MFVPGLQWLTVMLAGMQGTPALAAMRWWTSRGQLASHRREQTASLLFQCAQWWQRRVVHVLDRGFAGAPWLRELGTHQLRFILRWPTRYHLADDKGQRPAWHIPRGKRSQDHREIWDLHRRQYRKTQASWPSRCAIPKWMMPCGWWPPVPARGANRGTF